MKTKTIVVFILIQALFITACSETQSKPYAFYHWNTQLAPTTTLNDKIMQSGSERLYLRFFDLEVSAIDNHVFPIATLQIKDAAALKVKEIVPVIYIKNAVFSHKDGTGDPITALANEVALKIGRIKTASFSTTTFPEIHIDCDWTDSTQRSFFSFLVELQKNETFKSVNGTLQSPVLVSTLRLHQVKYRERTGVPPVHKVVIMAYNVGDLQNIAESNSIINNDITKKYLKRLKDYPLPYDVALPLFEWYVVYRDNALTALIQDTNSTLLNKYATPLAANKSTIHTDCTLNNVTLYKGDVLRLETVSFTDLKELATLIKSNASQDYQTLFYHINAPLTQTINHEKRIQIAL